MPVDSPPMSCSEDQPPILRIANPANRSVSRRLILGALAVAGWFTAQAADPSLVRDIHRGPSGDDSSPEGVQEVEGAVYFNAMGTQTTAISLWRTDGTAAGTVKVPGAVEGISEWDPRNFVRVGADRYFAAWKTGVASRLWKTDGTGDGTFPVENLPGVVFPENPENLTECGGLLYFSVKHGNNEVVVWRSDGTQEGTLPLTTPDVTATAIPGGFSGVRSFVVLGGVLHFIAGNSEIWRSGGTLESTLRVAQLEIGEAESIRELLPFNGSLYFLVDRFSGVDDLWRYEGAAEILTPIDGLPGEAGWASPIDLRILGDALVMKAWDAEHGFELWTGDGTTFTRVADIAPGSASSNPQMLESIDGVLFFNADNGKHGRELWRSDGTPGGTFLLRDFRKGAANGGTSETCVVGDRLFFTAVGKKVQALWTSDGTKSGTRLVKEFNMVPYNSWLDSPVEAGGLCYFSGNDGVHGEELWRSDGTAAGTVMVADLAGGNDDGFLQGASTTAFGGNYYFSGADQTRDHELWRSDGTEAGTFRLKDLARYPYQGDPQRFVTVAGRLVFSYSGKQSDELVWTSDGTSKGTRIAKGWPGIPRVEDVAELPAAACFLDDGNLYRVEREGKGGPLKLGGGFGRASVTGEAKLVRLGDAIFLSTYPQGFANAELWRSDGTAAGTSKVTTIPFSERITWLTATDAAFYFLSRTGSGTELWKSDGSAAGTVKVLDLPGTAPWGDAAVAGGRLFFFEQFSSSGWKLWTSDGTAEGTVALKTFVTSPSFGGSPWPRPVAMNGELYFRAMVSSGVIDLWKSDGTPGGTVIVRGSNPAVNVAPDEFTPAGGQLYFSAYGRDTGRELWRTDGTPEGTALVADLFAGDSDPQGLKVVGNRLLFHAVTAGIGRELWSLDLSAAAAPVLAASGSRAISSGNSTGGSLMDDDALLHRAFHPTETPSGIRRGIVPHTGTSYFPLVAARDGVLRIEFVRRREPGWTYTPQYSFHLGPDAFRPITEKIFVTEIDAAWERVVAEHSYDPAATPRIFGRVEVEGP